MTAAFQDKRITIIDLGITTLFVVALCIFNSGCDPETYVDSSSNSTSSTIEFNDPVASNSPSTTEMSAEEQFNLGNKYRKGEGIAQDYQEAAKWYRKAAEQGYALAQIDLGNAYYAGKGVPQDYKEYMKWNRMAADQGYARAQYNLGEMYFFADGSDGTPPGNFPSSIKAVMWFRLAAEQGHVDAQFYLGIIYDNGVVVPKDYKEAYSWFSIAAAGGSIAANQSLEQLKTRLSPEQLTEAQQRATRLHKQLKERQQRNVF